MSEIIRKNKDVNHVEQSKWITHYRLLTHNGLFNFSITNRGGGKTYNAKVIGINNFKNKRIRKETKKIKDGVQQFIERGEMFIYLRRYKTELKQLTTFFDAVQVEFPDDKLEVKGHVFYCNEKVCGYAMPLSTALTQRGLTFEYVSLIIFDEFIIDKGHIRYLDNEVEHFLNFYETVARSRNDVRVLFLGNAISLVNPYFVYWNIQPDLNKRFNRYKFDDNGLPFIVVEIHKNEEFVAMKKETRFGQGIAGTDFEGMAVDNHFNKDRDDFIEKRPSDSLSKYYCTVHYQGRNYGVWFNNVKQKFYISLKYDVTSKNVYAMTTNDFKVNMYLIDNVRNSVQLMRIKKAFLGQYLMFESQMIKTEMYNVLRLMGC